MTAGSRPGTLPQPPDVRRSRGYAASRAPAVAVSCRAERGHLVVGLSGALDGPSAPALRESLLLLVHQCAGRLVLDLSAVSYADAGGLTVLVGTARRARLLGGSLRLAALKPVVADALAATGLDRHLNIHAGVAAAISGSLRA